MRVWIEAPLDGTAERGMGLILISNSGQGKWRLVNATRHYFRCICAAKEVAFFCHSVHQPADSAATHLPLPKEAAGAGIWELRKMPELLHD